MAEMSESEKLSNLVHLYPSIYDKININYKDQVVKKPIRMRKINGKMSTKSTNLCHGLKIIRSIIRNRK